ncbi:MAG: aminotransferase class I/II-fold pyridoxal phosphate-dependent enzyme [Gammaproteobacteria bacterium]|nr:aminotransferase class I/II-fold pyridoxal phosphate-dependent enzyme [Gammaproteobacteria bacterium]MYE30683.1 aminotransferase class I/II-fold pyridoxal phosphate-dependent enzyme [Gammaproteobacteria bacterium]MYI01984.1 aminotransferase class I/II-fold pyridoxal phosphate-dependent enzyme [Gammaproteobacteria bacterium]
MQDDARRGLEMEPEEMLGLAGKAAEVLVDRTKALRNDRPWEGEFRAVLDDQFGGSPPEQGRPAMDVLEQAVRDILPFATRLDHPRCFGFVPTSPTWPGVVADFLCAGFNLNVATWLTASGASQLELVVVDWMRNWIGYPETAGGMLTSGGSAAILEALVTARDAAGNPQIPSVYMSDRSHSALKKAAVIVGVRRENIRVVSSDDDFRMDMSELRRMVSEDRARGLHPIAVCANAGTASTGAIDPLGPMADLCADESIWLHVDAAYGGFALVTERGKELLRGIERADSINLDAHKWFFQPYEAGALLVKDLKHLETTFAMGHDVLQDTIWGANHPNMSDRGLQLSRAARALKIWMSVQTFGMEKFRDAVRNGLELAQRAAQYIESSAALELTHKVTLGIVCFRFNSSRGDDERMLEEINRKVLAEIFWSEHAFFSSTSLKGKFTLRICIVNHSTTWEDVKSTLDLVARLGHEASKK